MNNVTSLFFFLFFQCDKCSDFISNPPAVYVGVLLVQLDTADQYFMSEYDESREAQIKEMSSSPRLRDGAIEQLLDLNKDFSLSDRRQRTDISGSN